MSTLNYHRSLESMPASTPSVGVSRSSVSRRFVVRTKAQVKGFFSSSLADVDLPVVMIDGIQMGDCVFRRFRPPIPEQSDQAPERVDAESSSG